MKTHLLKTSIAAAVLAMLTACGGGGGGDDIGSKVVQISFDEPQGVLEAGRLITIRGHAVSSSTQLTDMLWAVSGAGDATSTPSITNADCADVTRSDSNFGKGSSNWTCVLTLMAPKTLAQATTYELGLSAVGASYSGKGSTTVTVKPATVEANPIEVQFGTLPNQARAGEAINISGIISSSASLLTGARWTVVNSGANQASGFPVPALENADCAERSETVNPAGKEASTWGCTVRMIVSPRLQSAANYTLALVGSNANGFSLSNTMNVPVAVAPASSSKLSVAMSVAPTTGRAGDKITIQGTIKSTDAKLDIEKSHFSILNVVQANPQVGVQDGLMGVGDLDETNCVRATTSSGQVKDELLCSTTLTVPTSITAPLIVTYGLVGVDDEGASNYITNDITVQPQADAFGLRANVAYAPVPVVAGSPVNLTCQGQGSSNYTYSWRVANSGGTSISLSSATTTTGNASFNAPAPLVDTDVVVECGVSNGATIAYTPLTIRIPGATSPLGFRADVNATPNPVQTGNTVNLSCTGLGVANASYTYAWKVVNSGGLPVSITSGGPSSGAASFVAPSLPMNNGVPQATTVGLACSVSDGSRVIDQALDVLINP